MGFRRGLLLGTLLGLAGGLISGPPSEQRGAGPPSLLDKMRAAARDEREATETRLEERFRVAKETGSVPSDEG